MKDIKLFVRYGIIAFVVYLAWVVVSPTYIATFTDSTVNVLQVIVGSVFAALTIILRYHFKESIDD